MKIRNHPKVKWPASEYDFQLGIGAGFNRNQAIKNGTLKDAKVVQDSGYPPDQAPYSILLVMKYDKNKEFRAPLLLSDGRDFADQLCKKLKNDCLVLVHDRSWGIACK